MVSTNAIGTDATARIARWVATLPLERTAVAHPLAVDAFRDLLGCMIGGSGEDEPRRAARVASGWGGGATSIVGLPMMVPAPASAFANGTAAHVLDFDDSYAPLTGHPSAPVIAALLAVAEEIDASGSALLDAYVVGLEVIATIGRRVNPFHYSSGWHSTATIGLIGAAVACARLLRLDEAQIAATISIGVSCCSGTRMQLGLPMKSVHAGFAAQNAVIAAQLAASGLRGRSEALLGERGFVDMYAGGDPAEDGFTVPGSDEPFAIQSPGLTFKPYPTCGSTHRSLDALLALRTKHAFTADEVEAVRLVIPALNVRNLIYPRPQSGMEARFSMQYCAALAVAYGSIGLGDFDADAVFRPKIQRLLGRVSMETLPGSEATHKDYLELPAQTIVQLSSGQVLEDTRFTRRGDRNTPMTLAEQEAKFKNCAERVLGDDEVKELLALIAALPSATDIHRLTAFFRAARPHPIYSSESS